MTKLLSSLTTALIDQCSLLDRTKLIFGPERARDKRRQTNPKHTGKIKFHFGIQNLLLQNGRKKSILFCTKKLYLQSLK